MSYDNWKTIDTEMERAGRTGDALDQLISDVSDVWESRGLELSIDTPDLCKPKWSDQVYDYLIDDKDAEYIASLMMEAWIEDQEGDHGPWEMDEKKYRQMSGLERWAWRIRMSAIKISDEKRGDS
jgi:hypothetical protein|tara:strand:- start:1718 stop:2092 length:375 start_codon:yes stop_codon:yes gene_type:complete